MRDAHSDPETSLCLPTEHILLSAETDHGYVSLCAGLHSWHYRTGTPNHITYIFPTDNSAPYKNFSFSRVKVSTTRGDGAVYGFTDHHIQTAIFYIMGEDDSLPSGEITGLIQRKNHHLIKEILLKNRIDTITGFADSSAFFIHLQHDEKLKRYDDNFVVPKK